MASTFQVLFLFSLIYLSTPSPCTAYPFENIIGSLRDGGYNIMANRINSRLSSLSRISSTLTNSNFTVFVPTDESILEWEIYLYIAPEYHIASERLDEEVLEFLPFGTMINTLDNDLKLVVTNDNTDYFGSSINGVKIKEWDIYSDERVVVHAVENILDPSQQQHLQ